jgi:hypothetical protein
MPTFVSDALDINDGSPLTPFCISFFSPKKTSLSPLEDHWPIPKSRSLPHSPPMNDNKPVR